MAKLLSADLNFLNEMADKYRFRDFTEIEQEDAYDFCRCFMQAVSLGLNPDPLDASRIAKIRDNLCEGY